MKKMFLALIVVALFFATGCTTRQYVSEEIEELVKELQFRERIDGKLMVREPTMDINSDGKISQQEFNQSIERQFSAFIRKADNNGDSEVSLQEFIEYRKKGPFIIVYKGMDENKDGRIAEKEFDHFNKELFSNLLKYYGVDHKGKLSKEKFALLHETLFAKIDINNDSSIDQRELSLFIKTAPVPRAMPSYMKRSAFIATPDGGHFPIWDPWDDITWPPPEDPCQGPYPPDACPHPDHPGCTYGDVRSGNAVDIWPGELCDPFF
jgi:Ca2+-binding EF-hand superfamily protein